MSKIASFVRECGAELRKVNWPTRDDVVSSVLVVLSSTVVIAALLGAFDLAYARLMRLVF